MANAYLTEEASLFCSHYFEPHVHTRHRKIGRNDDGGGDIDTVPETYKFSLTQDDHMGSARDDVSMNRNTLRRIR
ncbi:hypothetical protein, partial [Klebsiella variicola]|uniref:hypothetical protein n=1 Tax=Klebsiella variicola TaxID=244366 RepID=UPI00272F4EBF